MKNMLTHDIITKLNIIFKKCTYMSFVVQKVDSRSVNSQQAFTSYFWLCQTL